MAIQIALHYTRNGSELRAGGSPKLAAGLFLKRPKDTCPPLILLLSAGLHWTTPLSIIATVTRRGL